MTRSLAVKSRHAILVAALLAATPALAADAWPDCGSRRVAGERCVVDGDTIRVDRERIRLVDIDAPELHGACRAERFLAIWARSMLAWRLASGPVTIDRRGVGRYGRTLARVTVRAEGKVIDVGAELLSLGLAQPWPNRGNVWCGK